MLKKAMFTVKEVTKNVGGRMMFLTLFLYVLTAPRTHFGNRLQAPLQTNR